jgi:hypothetical protein
MAPGRIRRAIGARPADDTELARSPRVSASARNAASRTDRGLNASLNAKVKRTRGSSRNARRDTA